MLRTTLPKSLLSDTQRLARRAAQTASRQWPRWSELPTLLEQLNCQVLKRPDAGFADELAESARYIVAAAQVVFTSAADRQAARQCQRTDRALQSFA